MRIDSCRTCGEMMQEFQRCDVCNGITKFICRGCKKASDEQVHPECGISGKTAIPN